MKALNSHLSLGVCPAVTDSRWGLGSRKSFTSLSLASPSGLNRGC